MSNNLIAELIKSGIAPRDIAKEIAKTLNVSEKTARNKINGCTDWLLPEAMKINETYFGGEMSIEYLFARTQEPA